jgi:competence protein ComEA
MNAVATWSLEWPVRAAPLVDQGEDIMFRSAIVLALALVSQWAIAALNLNTATKEELIALPGIGPAKAQAILDYRKANGAFKTVEELKDIKGIGAKRFEKLKPELTVAPPAAVKAASAATKPAASAKGEIRAAEAHVRK